MTNQSPAPGAATGAQPAPGRALFAGTDWFDFTVDSAGDDAAFRKQQRLSDTLMATLGSDQLVVLAGLGTSLALRNVKADGSIESARAPTMAALFEAVEVLQHFDKAWALAPSAVKESDVESLLSACQFKVALDDDADIKAFLALAELRILELCSFVTPATDLSGHEIFLRKLARRQTKLSRTQVFTTNYDLAFEEASRRIRFHVVDGFGFGSDRSFDGNTFDLDIVRRRKGDAALLEPNVLHLHKLHGSVDWDNQGGEIVRSSSPANPVLIYPSQDKYQLSFQPPYLESMSRSQIALRQPDVTLVIAGFGFNDAHIVAPIDAAVRSNIGLRIVVVGPSLASAKSTSVKRLVDLTKAGDRRVTLIQTTFADFAALLPDTSPQDERELHESRTSDAWRSA